MTDYPNHGPAATGVAGTALKLLRVALDPAAGEGEAVNAATLFVRVARRGGVTFGVLALAAAEVAPFTGGPPRPADAPLGSVRMRCGKHAGRRLVDGYADDPAYVAWVANSFNDARIARAAREVLDAADVRGS